MKIKLIRKIAKYSAVTLLILLFIIIGLLIFVLKTSIGSRYALQAVPGLTVKNPIGTLSGGWSADELIWQNDTIKITASNPTLTWYASCLFKANACIENININQLDIDIFEDKKTDNTKQNDKTASVLPNIRLPISIEVSSATLNQLRINKQEIINKAHFKNTTWQQATIRVNSLTLQNKETKANLSLQGQLDFENNWPLTATASLNLDSFINQPWQLDISVNGNLEKQLKLAIQSKGYLTSEIKATANVLDDELPAELTLLINNFYPNNIKNLPDNLRVNELKLNAKGNLKKGYSIEASSILKGDKEPINVKLKALANTEQLNLQALTINSSNEQQFIKANAILKLSPSLSATGEITYQQFPIQALYPIELPIDIKAFTAHGEYTDNNYHAKLAANLVGPSGGFTLNTSILGDLKKLIIENLNIATIDKSGYIDGKATVTLSPSIAWQSNLVLKDINPNYWIKNLSGSLTGTVDSQGQLINDSVDTTNKINIQGLLNKQPTHIQAQVIGKQKKWQIPNLSAKIGSNTLSGNAKLAEKISAKLNINLPRLQQIAPVLSGSLIGAINMEGALEKPQGNIKLTGNQLIYENNQIRQLQLIAGLNNQQYANLNLQANHINVGTTNFGNLVIKGSGNITQQQVTMQLTGGILKLLTDINSSQDNQKNWLVHINKLTLASFGQNWQLDETTALSYHNNGELTIDKHCFRNGTASLCALEKQRLLPYQDIHYQLSQFQIESLKHWYPDTFNWKALLSAKMQIKLNQYGPSGIIAINANNGALQLRDSTEDTWHDIPYQTLSLTADLKPEKIIARLNFSGTDLGIIQSQVMINPLKHNKPIQGDFNIKNFNISIFRPFIAELNELTGNINGQGTIQGLLEKPYISGKIALTNGRVLGDIPISLEKLQTTAIIEGESLKLNGSWVSGSEGHAAINGNVNWSGMPSLQVNIKASKLPIIVAPYGNLEADTNLIIGMSNNILNVTGTIDIPKGALKIRELPASTITVSPDAIIVTNKTSEEKTSPIKLNTDITINIGKEKLSLQGFGLTSDITGNLSVTKNLFTQGDINLNNGIYRAYGQKLKITKAHILFTGSPTEPSLDIEATRTVDNVTAGIRVTGSATQPKVTIFSTPSMSQDQALSYIIFGRPISAGDNNVLAQAALAIGVSGGSAVVGEYADKIGIHDFELETSGTGDNTSVVASGKINDRLSVHYGVSIFNAINTLMFRYQLTKSIYLEAASGTASSLDIFYKHSFK